MRRYFPIVLIVWAITIIGAFSLNLYVLRKHSESLVQSKSEGFFKLLVATLQWHAGHEALYVPITELSQPNLHLVHHDRRDVITNFGDSLTLLSPALMTRQMSEYAKENNIKWFHITSLNPIHPENAPDEWEIYALHTFQEEDDRAFEKMTNSDSVIYRYMAPLFVEQSCLICHAAHGFNIGKLRGGISINTSYEKDYLSQTSTSTGRLVIIYLLICIVGFFLLFYIELLTKRHRLAVEAKHDELQDFVAAKDKFISVITHDLKTPAANIASLSETLRVSFDTLSEADRKNCIDMLVESARTHNNLLNSLFDVSRLRLGHIQCNPERLDIRKLTHTVLEQTKLQAQQKHIAQINQAGEYYAYADKNMITTVIRNLVVNGIKFTHQGGQIVIKTEKKEEDIIISVTDSGIGIADAKKDRIFGVDSDKSTSGTANEAGTGLGLLLCKEYVERHGGQIWLESEVGKGTTFFFTLPLVNSN